MIIICLFKLTFEMVFIFVAQICLDLLMKLFKFCIACFSILQVRIIYLIDWTNVKQNKKKNKT